MIDIATDIFLFILDLKYSFQLFVSYIVTVNNPQTDPAISVSLNFVDRPFLLRVKYSTISLYFDLSLVSSDILEHDIFNGSVRSLRPSG